MFKKVRMYLGVSIPALLATPQAWTHPTGQAALDTPVLLQHWLSSPLHLGLSLATAFALAVFARKIVASNTKNRRP